MNGYTLSRSAVRYCAGIVECTYGCPGTFAAELWSGIVARAERVVGSNYGDDPKAQEERARLIEAVKQNLMNRWEHPYEQLARKYELPLSLSSFKREKRKFCYELAKLAGLT